MTREKFEKMRNLALAIQKMCEEAFPGERVEVVTNRSSKDTLSINVGDLGDIDEFYIWEGEEMISTDRPTANRLWYDYGSPKYFRFEEEVS